MYVLSLLQDSERSKDRGRKTRKKRYGDEIRTNIYFIPQLNDVLYGRGLLQEPLLIV
jgi:hypothetical protein